MHKTDLFIILNINRLLAGRLLKNLANLTFDIKKLENVRPEYDEKEKLISIKENPNLIHQQKKL